MNDPRIYDVSFFPVNRTLKQSYCCKNNTLCRLKHPRITKTPTIYWNDTPDKMPWPTAALTINWSKRTAVIHG